MNAAEDPGFAPSDLTDGRAPLDWKSKYPPEALKSIRWEGIYLAFLLFLVPISILIFCLGYPNNWLEFGDWYRSIVKYSMAWLGGLLGGTLFSIKWLYHAVAKQKWHLDRRLWRIFTPHISGALGFAVIALISSGILRIFDPLAVESLSLVLGVSFLVGYFSDSTIAKLSEIAETLFGAGRGREKHKNLPHMN